MMGFSRETGIDQIRQHTQELVNRACDEDDPVLIEAPPGSGKSTAAYKLPNHKDTPITYLANRTDLYEQAMVWCEENATFDYEVIPSPQRSCPTFRGKNDGDKQKVERLFQKGYSGRKIHYLKKDVAYTPCMSPDDPCPYIQTMERIEDDIESIDLLIGHHMHSYRRLYTEDRIVVIDEFNPQPFLTQFPDDDAGVIDSPGETIPYFLEQLGRNDDTFPSSKFEDVTDILDKRSDPDESAEAIEWFTENGVSRGEVEDFDFWEVSTYRHDRTHLRAPLLAFSLFCMEKVGPGVELAPARDNTHLKEQWESADLRVGTRCIRDRNTGEMHLLEPPNLGVADQVIGLDGLPTVELWNLVFSPGEEFEHRKVIDRDDFSEFLGSAMDMTVVQIGDGMHPYAGGRVYPTDERRFAAVKALEGRPFALISTKKALDRYDKNRIFGRYVKRDPACRRGEDDHRMICARNYGTVLSSNAFETESLGVVSGSPFPGNHIVRLWAGLAGKAVDTKGGGEDKTFGEFGDEVFQHFTHHQVVQAILRFGRDRSVLEDGGATVYVNTKALPDWFEVDYELDVQFSEKKTSVIEELIKAKREARRGSPADHSVVSLQETIEEDISEFPIREILRSLKESELVTIREGAGKGSADLYRWDGDDDLLEVDDSRCALQIEEKVFVLSIPAS